MERERKVTAAISGALAAYMSGAPQPTTIPEQVTREPAPHQTVSPWRILARQQLVQRRNWWQSLRNSPRHRSA